MQLVKDFLDEGIVLYWVEDSRQVSPFLHTMVDAEEWWKKYQFAQYEGKERRRTIYDRRSNLEMRKHFELNGRYIPPRPNGRRSTDQPVFIALDLFEDKMKGFYAAHN
jgi:hypothetical protein